MACCSCFGPGTPSSFPPSGKKYSRELQSFSELIYDAGGREEGRLGGYGSTTGLLRRRSGPDGRNGGTVERHASAVDDLQDTLRDMSYHERDKLLRTDLLLLAPVVRELFPYLPETHYTYVLPYADDLDERASDYLASVLESMRIDLGATVVPLHTTGDGNCLLHAASRGIWGVELFSDLLRHKVCEELQDHHEWYESKLSRAEVAEALEQVRQPYRFLSNLHIVALAHVIRRPVILYASHRDVLDFGCGYYGMAGMFGPTRFDVDSWYPRPLAVAWSSHEHNHFVPLVWSASQAPVEWPVQDEGPRAPRMTRTKSFDMHDPFAVPPEHRALLWARARGVPVPRPVFVQRLVEQIRQQVVQLQGHMLARMLDSGALDQNHHEEGNQDWASAPLQPPPASSIALSFAPYEAQNPSHANGRSHAFEYEKSQQNGDVFEAPAPPPFQPAFFANPLHAPAEQGAAASPFDPFDPAVGATNPFLNQLPRSGTSYSDSTPVSWPPPKHDTETYSTVRHNNLSSHVAASSVEGSISVDPHVYHSKPLGRIQTGSQASAAHQETGPGGSPRPANRSPRTPKPGSVLNPLSELNPLAALNGSTQIDHNSASPTIRTPKSDTGLGLASGDAVRNSKSPSGEGAKRRASEGPFADPVVKRTARRLSAEPPSHDTAQRRWKVASHTIRGAVRMRRAALAVKVDLPAGLKGGSPWWKPGGDEGRLKVREGEDPILRAQAISRSLSTRTRIPLQSQASGEGGIPADSEGNGSALATVPKPGGQLMKKVSGDVLVHSGQYLKDERGRVVWVSLAKQITRKLEGVAVADAALQILAKPCPMHHYAAAASRQPEIAMLAATMVRLAAEYRLLTAKPLPGIRVSLPNEDDLFVCHAVLTGPQGTPWEGRFFPVEIHVPPEYPRRPPDSVRFLTEIFHPNVDQHGVPYLDFVASRSAKPGSSPTREELVSTRKGGAKELGKDGESRSGEVVSASAGEELGGAESRTADEIVVAAERLLSVASLNAESESGDACSGTREGGSGAYDGKGQRGRQWDPYQGLSFVLKSVQQLLWDVDLENVVNNEAAALFRQDRAEWERQARRAALASGICHSNS